MHCNTKNVKNLRKTNNTLISLFLVSQFNFLFIPWGRQGWLPVSFSLDIKYTLPVSSRIIS